jgi:hypothetical protein
MLDVQTPMRPNRPHIPSFITLSKSGPQTKNVRSASYLAYPFAPCLQIFRGFAAAFATVPSRHRRRSASVRGYLRIDAGTRKREKHDCRKKFARD